MSFRNRDAILCGALPLLLLGAACSGEDATALRALGDGRFEQPLDPVLGTEPPEAFGGAITWEYVGQASYVSPADRARFVEDKSTFDEGAVDLPTRLRSTIMEDAHGRTFRVAAIDEAKLAANIRNYDARIAAEYGSEPLAAERPEALDPEPEPAARVTPLSWSRTDQTGDGILDRFLWDGEDRDLVSDPLTDRQEKVVIYFFGDVGLDGGHCSGTLIGDYWVLTAAHCVLDDSGQNWINADDNVNDGRAEAMRGKVCTEGNYYSGANCANVVLRTVSGWGGVGDMGDDIAVLEIDEPLGRGKYMALSQASNGTLKDELQYNIGYPGRTPGNSDNTFNCGVQNAGDPYGGWQSDAVAPCESKQYWDSNECNYTSTKVIGTRIDVSKGHSGGPIYYYPDGGSATDHFLTGVVSGHHDGTFDDYNGGPKVPYHRSWIISVMD